MDMVTPPPGFDPLAADEVSLAKYGFPLPPSDPEDFEAWYAAMKAYKWSAPPTEPFAVPLGRPGPGDAFTTLVDGWGGYVAGTFGVQNHTYVAVKGNFHVPSNTGCDSGDKVGFWIGLGGTGGTYAPDNLVQQGIACSDSRLGSGSAFRPFYEFANTDYPHALCGTTATLAAGDVIYQNMSFQTSQNRAFFYMEDQTTGQAWPCSYVPPSGWHWDLNTAEWIGEAPGYYAYDFGSVTFTNARAELYSNSTWVTLGSQPVTQMIEGQDVGGHSYRCIDPGAISGGTSFVDDWVSRQCRYVVP